MLVIPARVALRLRAGPDAVERLRADAAGRPLVIELMRTVVRGFAVGHLIVRFAPERPPTDYVLIDPIADVPVIVERRLEPLLRRGASLQKVRSWLRSSWTIELDRAEDWLDFLDGRLAAGA